MYDNNTCVYIYIYIYIHTRTYIAGAGAGVRHGLLPRAEEAEGRCCRNMC